MRRASTRRGVDATYSSAGYAPEVCELSRERHLESSGAALASRLRVSPLLPSPFRPSCAIALICLGSLSSACLLGPDRDRHERPKTVPPVSLPHESALQSYGAQLRADNRNRASRLLDEQGLLNGQDFTDATEAVADDALETQIRAVLSDYDVRWTYALAEGTALKNPGVFACADPEQRFDAQRPRIDTRVQVFSVGLAAHSIYTAAALCVRELAERANGAGLLGKRIPNTLAAWLVLLRHHGSVPDRLWHPYENRDDPRLDKDLVLKLVRIENDLRDPLDLGREQYVWNLSENFATYKPEQVPLLPGSSLQRLLTEPSSGEGPQANSLAELDYVREVISVNETRREQMLAHANGILERIADVTGIDCRVASRYAESMPEKSLTRTESGDWLKRSIGTASPLVVETAFFENGSVEEGDAPTSAQQISYPPLQPGSR